MTAATFELTAALPTGRTLIEASAGTGKTYAIAVLVARFVAGDLGHDHDLAEGVGDRRGARRHVHARRRRRAARSHPRQDAAGRRPPRRRRDPSRRRVAAGVRRRIAAGAPAPRARGCAGPSPASTRRRSRRFTASASRRWPRAGCAPAAAARRELSRSDRELITEVVRDLLLDRLADDPLRPVAGRCGPSARSRVVGPGGGLGPATARAADDVERYLVAAVRAVLSNPGARMRAVTVDRRAGRRLGGRASPPPSPRSRRRQRARRQIGYDRLVSDLAAALADPRHGAQLAAQLAGRYRARPRRRVPGHRPPAVGDLRPRLRRSPADHRRRPQAGDLPFPRCRRARLPRRRAQRRAHDVADQPPLRPATARRPRRAVRLAPASATPTSSSSRVDASPAAHTNALGETAVHLRVVPDDPAIAHTTHGMEAGAAAESSCSPMSPPGCARCSTRPASGRDATPGGCGPPTSASSCRRSGGPRRRPPCCVSGASRPSGPAPARCCSAPAAPQWRLLLAGLAAPTDAGAAKAAGAVVVLRHRAR